MDERTPQTTCSRRALLAAGTGAAAAAATGATGSALAQEGTPTNGTAANETNGTAGTATATPGGPTPDFGGYLDEVSNYDGTVTDARGQDSVSVSVGAEGNNGFFAFDPAAVHVDNGTTVTWEWTGQGSSHNVVHEGGDFESDLKSEEGATFEHTFEEDGIYTYFCRPHKGSGMKGAIVVGDDFATVGGDGAGSEEESGPTTAANELALQTLLVMVVLGLLSPVLFLLFARRTMGSDGSNATPPGPPE